MISNSNSPSTGPKPHMNRIWRNFAGAGVLASFLTLASDSERRRASREPALSRRACVMPQHVADSAYFGAGQGPAPVLSGVHVRGHATRWPSLGDPGRRVHATGARDDSFARRRIVMALAGGILAGFASRVASGCTSGQG